MKGTSVMQDVGQVGELIASRRNGASRLVVGIAGPPASGKSTLAEALVSHLNQDEQPGSQRAALLPMDGYHLDNELLRSRGLLSRKGAPETFDSQGFCKAVLGVHDARTEMFFPSFDRERDIAIANSISIGPDIDVIVVEGNYLLLTSDPWVRMKELFALTVFLSPGLEVLRQRLQARWTDHGLDPQAAFERVSQNDLPNAELVLRQSGPADVVLEQTWSRAGAPAPQNP